MAKGGKQKRTGAIEVENRRGAGRPPGPPLSEEEEKKKREEKIRKDREYRAKKTSQLKEYEDFCGEPIIADMFKAFRERKKQEFNEELKQLEEVLMNDGTNEDFEMSTGSLADGMGIPFEPPTRELKRKREEELAEARRGKIPATADNYTLPHIPIGGSQPRGLMAKAPQTAHQSALPGHGSRKVAQQNEEPKWINLPVQKQHDTYVPKCPSSHAPGQTQLPQLDVPSWMTAVMPGMGSQVDPVSLGFHCRKRPPHESCYTEVVISKMLDQIMSEMQERLQWMEDNIKAQIQSSFVAALTQFGSCLQANAPIVSPTEPYHDPLYMQEGTNAAAGYSGGPTAQSFSNNEEEDEKGIPSEELEKLEKAIEEDLANQYFDEEIQMQIFSKDLSVTSDKFQLKDNEAFCEEPGITDMFKDSEEKRGQKFKFKELFNKLEKDLKRDGTLKFLSLEDPQPEMLAGPDLVRQKYRDDYGLPVPVIGEPHHDPAGMQDGNTAAAAAGSSGVPNSQ